MNRLGSLIASEATLAATFAAMLFVNTIGAVAPFSGKRYLPSPSRYLATFLMWGLLGLFAAFGPRAGRLASRISVVALLTAVVVGPFGKKAVGFLDLSARFFPSPSAEGGATP